MDSSKQTVTWKDVKAGLAGKNERELLKVIRDLYQKFLTINFFLDRCERSHLKSFFKRGIEH